MNKNKQILILRDEIVMSKNFIKTTSKFDVRTFAFKTIVNYERNLYESRNNNVNENIYLSSLNKTSRCESKM